MAEHDPSKIPKEAPGSELSLGSNGDSDLADKIGNPLTGLKNRLFILNQRSGGDPKLKGHVDAMEKDIKRLEHVVRDLQAGDAAPSSPTRQTEPS